LWFSVIQATLFNFCFLLFNCLEMEFSDYVQLVQEYQGDEYGAEILYAEEVGVEELAAHGTPVGELIAHNLVVKIPTDEETGKESAEGQEYLSRDEVEPIEH